jgi:hypothetical protein
VSITSLFKRGAIGAAVAGALLVAAPVHAQQNTLRVVMHSDLKIVDPIWTTAYITRNHGYMIYDTLFAMDAKGDIKPQMVDKWTVSPDNLTWTFVLRDGLMFHDDKPVTSEDVVASIKRWAQKDSLGQKLFSFVKDFAPVSLILSQPNILVVHPSVPARSVKDLVALARARPGTLGYASGGNGSSPHLSGELFRLVAGIDIVHIPYKSSGPGVTDLLGGHVPMMFVGPLAVDGFVRSGRLRALAVADARRNAVFPAVPTMKEAGFGGVETGTWFGITAPAATPRQVIATANAAMVKALASRDLKAKLDAIGVDIVASTPEAFGTHITAEIAKWANVVRKANVKMD